MFNICRSPRNLCRGARRPVIDDTTNLGEISISVAPTTTSVEKKEAVEKRDDDPYENLRSRLKEDELRESLSSSPRSRSRGHEHRCADTHAPLGKVEIKPDRCS